MPPARWCKRTKKRSSSNQVTSFAEIGGHARGWLALGLEGGGNLCAGVAAFREEYPKALRWNSRELEIALWAEEGGNYEWIEGIGKTHHIALFYGAAAPAGAGPKNNFVDFVGRPSQAVDSQTAWEGRPTAKRGNHSSAGPSPPDAQLLAEGPVLALASPEWYTRFGRFRSADHSRPKWLSGRGEKPCRSHQRPGHQESRAGLRELRRPQFGRICPRDLSLGQQRIRFAGRCHGTLRPQRRSRGPSPGTGRRPALSRRGYDPLLQPARRLGRGGAHPQPRDLWAPHGPRARHAPRRLRTGAHLVQLLHRRADRPARRPRHRQLGAAEHRRANHEHGARRGPSADDAQRRVRGHLERCLFAGLGATGRTRF